ncbi:sigma factor [Chitinophaga sancti]|uniref:Sigma factor n=1 Tax=Chitinophaga sancti TaxID=1004 RepID=A0A1K1SVY8_9BACT|nr:sigma factor [Chitinophaga sancti]WQD61097.1 sigma factor [Chitinophaga sancti]WQG86774.1 sigma factor [Chitinophaga sancti]SFW88498.1 Sigma-70 region 2 [Chitinophaga sancti]
MITSEDTAMLSALTKDNSLVAYQYFFMKYYKPLCLKASTMLGNMDEAREIVQKIFIEVWKTRQYQEIEHAPGGFFYQIVDARCRQLQEAALVTAQQYKATCPPCETGPALVPTSITTPLIMAIER